MTLTPAEEKEFDVLLRDCGLTLYYPEHYKFIPGEDCYEEINDKHEWHDGADVRRLNVLAHKRNSEQFTNKVETNEGDTP